MTGNYSTERFRNINYFPAYKLPHLERSDDLEIKNWHRGIILPITLGLNNRIKNHFAGETTIRVRCPNRSMAVASKCLKENYVQSHLLSLWDIGEMQGVIYCIEGTCNVRNLSFFPRYPMTSIVGIAQNDNQSFLEDEWATKEGNRTMSIEERLCNECGANYTMILTNSGVNDQHQYHGTVEEVVVVESWPTRTFAVDPLLLFHMCPITCTGSDKCVMFGDNCKAGERLTIDDPKSAEMAHRVIYHRLPPENKV